MLTYSTMAVVPELPEEHRRVRLAHPHVDIRLSHDAALRVRFDFGAMETGAPLEDVTAAGKLLRMMHDEDCTLTLRGGVGTHTLDLGQPKVQLPTHLEEFFECLELLRDIARYVGLSGTTLVQRRALLRRPSQVRLIHALLTRSETLTLSLVTDDGVEQPVAAVPFVGTFPFAEGRGVALSGALVGRWQRLADSRIEISQPTFHPVRMHVLNASLSLDQVLVQYLKPVVDSWCARPDTAFFLDPEHRKVLESV